MAGRSPARTACAVRTVGWGCAVADAHTIQTSAPVSAGTTAASRRRHARRRAPLQPLRDGGRHRERVLQIAQEALGDDGLTISFDEIARRAGFGVGTVYRHFPTKEALFEAVLLGRIERFVAAGPRRRAARGIATAARARGAHRAAPRRDRPARNPVLA